MANMVTYPLNKIEYQATDAELFHCTRNSGVYSGDDFSMSVTGANNIVTFAPGIAWIRNGKFTGKVIASKENVSLDFGVADSALPRWDIACIQFNKNNNATDIVVKKGTAASSPVLPAITQAETLYELYLCKVYRPAGSVAITADNVYDTRLDKSICGLMADSVTSVDTSAINEQIDALIEKLRTEISDVQSGAGIMTKSVYDADNDGMVDKSKLAETATTAENGVFTYTHSKSGIVHNLEGAEFKGNIANIRFGASADWKTGDKLTINGIEARIFNTVLERLENNVLFKQFSRVEMIIAYKGSYYECFFRTGGGVSNGELAKATATVEDVRKGKTFCAGDEKLQTGTAEIIEGNLWIGNGETTAQGDNGVTVKCVGQGTYTNAFQAKPIDVTNVNSITFTVTDVAGTIGANYYSLVAVRNTQGYNTAGYGNYKIVTGAGDYTVDVSGLSGLYVPVVQAGYMDGASVTISGYSIN